MSIQDGKPESDIEFKRYMQFSKNGISGDAFNSVTAINMNLGNPNAWFLIRPNQALSYADYLQAYKPNSKDRTMELTSEDMIKEFDVIILRINELIGNGVTNEEQAKNIQAEIESLRKLIYD
jgi:hypothetical protein